MRAILVPQHVLCGMMSGTLVHWSVRRSAARSNVFAACSSFEPEIGENPYALGKTLADRCTAKAVRGVIFNSDVRSGERWNHESARDTFAGLLENGMELAVDARGYLEDLCHPEVRETVWVNILKPLRARGVKFVFPLELRKAKDLPSRYRSAQTDFEAVDNMVQHLIKKSRTGTSESIFKPFYTKKTAHTFVRATGYSPRKRGGSPRTGLKFFIDKTD
uniref:Uncharacterized protein n=1 Tax=Rhodosorus marinus TaxID=101924 RepID=A0A7S0G310_9RHOD|mmetsp:Transcript_187/g.160  ORF Transcript_187/g.160 Transcript_187/m.160 type:complete len:219 (+) Transcript_187:151-807(+)